MRSPDSAQDALDGRMQRPIHRTTAGASVATTAEFGCDPRNINLAFATQAHAEAPVGQFTEKSRDLHIADCESVIHQPFAIFFFRAHAIHLLLRDPDPRQRTFALQS